ncbi:hypothetical protein FOA52_002744 [Chlamydomonas sp. UWO 241]|nr:hypothetical protein FOA52_002744 [Chlamydomonas sp. UWO 241]
MADTTTTLPPGGVPPGEAEGGGAILWLWIPSLLLGHAFALYWLWQALALARPGLRGEVRAATHGAWAALMRALHRCGRAVAWRGKQAVVAGTLPISDGRHQADSAEVDLEVKQEAAMVPPCHGAATVVTRRTSSTAKHQHEGQAGGDSAHEHDTSTKGEGEGDEPASMELIDPVSLKLLRDAGSRLTPVRLDWSDVCVTRSTSSGPKCVLRSVSGCAEPGHMVALMGASGSGKSTLLDVLAMRGAGAGSSAARVSGAVLVNGRRRSGSSSSSGGISSHGSSNGVGGGHGTPRHDVEDTVNRALSVMGLQNQAHTLVGGTLLGGFTLRGISGGERRRLAIAAACLGGPSLLMLDEPTSGLDSFSALSVSFFLRALANAGHTLLVSIHQPRAGIWGMFDRVLLLSSGAMMYEGPVSQMVPWFTGPQMGFRQAGLG